MREPFGFGSVAEGTDTVVAGVDLADLLRPPAAQAVILLPSCAGVAHALIVGGVRDPVLFVSLSALVLVLGTVSVLAPWRERAPDARVARQWEQRWQLFALGVGFGALAPFLNLAVEVGVELYAPIVALVLVIGAFGFPERYRLPMLCWVVLVWLVTLVWAGIAEPSVLLLHAGGVLAVGSVALRGSSVLARDVAREGAARDAAATRVRLLASLARTNRLDPDDVLHSMIDGLLSVDFDLASVRVLDLDAGVARLLAGASRTDISLVEHFPLPGSDHEVVSETGEPLLRRSAGSFPGEASSGPIRDVLLVPLVEHGEVRACLTAATALRPISDDMAAAARLLAQGAQEALERAEAYRADTATVEELRRLDLRTRDFVATVSHELRTPLTVVQGLGQTLLARWEDLPDDRRVDLLDRLDANTDRLAAMLGSLLDTSAIAAGRLRPVPRVVDLRALLGEVVPRVTAAARTSEGDSQVHEVAVELDGDVQAWADPSLLEHVLENLLGNALKHTPPGTRVMVRARRARDGVHVEVADEGPGIAPEDLPYVFDRFYRGGRPDRRAASGLGLGLAFARSLVVAHDSALTVDSRPGAGTRFGFTLPSASQLGPADGGSAGR